jgi:hypothetical protein
MGHHGTTHEHLWKREDGVNGCVYVFGQTTTRDASMSFDS